MAKKKKRKRGRFELKPASASQKSKCVQYDVVWEKPKSEPRRKRSRHVPSQVFFE